MVFALHKNNISLNNLLLEHLADEFIERMQKAELTPDDMLGVIQNVRMRLKLNYYSNRTK